MELAVLSCCVTDTNETLVAFENFHHAREVQQADRLSRSTL